MIRQFSTWFIYSSVLGLAGIASASAATEQDTPPVQVMTFNIRYNNPQDGENAWPHRKDMVADIIGEGADIACLQEARLEQIQDLEQRLPGFKWYGVGRDDGKQSGEFCPIFYRHDRYDLLDQKTLWLSETPDVAGSKSWDTAITRLVTLVQFSDKRTDTAFWVLNTHFDHIGVEARKNSARLIRESFGRLAPRQPVIVAGDFNCTPKAAPYAIMTAPEPGPKMIDSRTISQRSPTGPNSTWCGFREVKPGRRIDFIFVSPGIKVQRHRTIDEKTNGRFPSDHLPVVVDLALGTSP
ncbi:MAG: endonuclease/exonuclease/phosphatase family protein [Planctomycetota bacterium]